MKISQQSLVLCPSNGTIRLRLLDQRDAPEFLRVHSRPDKMQFYGWPVLKTLDEARSLIAECEEEPRIGEGIWWAITLADSDRYLGECAVTYGRNEHHRADVAVLISPCEDDKRILASKCPRTEGHPSVAEQAIRLLTEFVFQHTDVNRIQGFIDPENDQSIRIMLAADYRREGLLKGYEYEEGRPVDEVLVALTRREYLVRRLRP